ncbi:MAG TPA: ATP-binding protein [Chitinophagaceae bacterium]|nr:ATP-binding protein [Chitinophagaceae bacterium]
MYREIYKELVAHLEKKEFTILTGARQTGKSTLLKQLETRCKEQFIPCVFLNLENKEILGELNLSPLSLLNYLPLSQERVIVLIDEIQYLGDPSNFLKLLYDEHAQFIKIVATGSSAFYLDDHFKDSLVGRKRVFQLLTCNFNEYLELNNKEELLEEKKRILSHKKAKSKKINYLKNELETFMVYGGYPAVVTEPDQEDKMIRLKEIRDSFVKRDIMESGVHNEISFYNLFRLLASQCGQLVNVNELSATLSIKGESVNNYLHVLQKCFHLALVKPFYHNLRKELTKMSKPFMLDMGLRNCLLNNFQPVSSRSDRGALWENFFYRMLVDKFGQDAIHYWRTADGNEVDFVLPEITTPFAIELKYNEALVKPGKYKKFIETYPEIPLHFAWLNPMDEAFFRRLTFSLVNYQ